MSWNKRGEAKTIKMNDGPIHVHCPCLNCGFSVWMNYGPKEVRLDEKQALDKLIRHLKNDHTLSEIFEWLERCAVQHFDSEVVKEKAGK